MEFLQSIVQILSFRKVLKIDTLDKSLISSKDSILTRFYEGIANSNFKTDNEAIVYLYGDISDSNVKNYRQLKSRFKKRLLNTLFFIDVNSKDYETDVQRCYFECIRSLQELNIVQKYGGNQSLVFELIMDNYGTALKYDFFDVLKEYNYKLITYYSLKGNIIKFLECKEQFEYFKAQQSTIEDSYLVFSTINCDIEARKKTELVDISFWHGQLNDLENHANSYLSICYIYLSRILLYNTERDIEALSNVCDLFLEHLDTKDNAFRQSFKGIANSYKISTLLHLNDYSTGIKYIDKNIHNLFGINWFEAMDTKLKFALNLRNIELANDILKAVYAHKSFSQLPPNIQEKWFIYEGYVVFYDNYINNGNYKFNLGKLINRIPHYFHDKSGYNLSIIILQLLFHLARNKKDEAMQLIGSLRIYKTRYLKDEDQIRSAEFLRLLLYFEKKGLNKRRVGSLTMSYLNAVPKNSFILDHEIIAYETLLDIIMDLA